MFEIYGARIVEEKERFYTVFPKEPNEMPQDFPTYSEAREYGDEKFGRDNYVIESPF